MLLLNTLACLLGVVSAAAVPTHPSSALSSYPESLNTTSKYTAYHLYVISSDPYTNGQNIQLYDAGNGTQIAVVDQGSPVLQARFSNGVLHSEGYTTSNTIYNLGPVAHLRNQTSTNSSSLQELYFSNTTKPDAGWSLEDPSSDAVYRLFHQEPLGVVNGFLICDTGTYFQVYYNTYLTSPPDYYGCEFVGIGVSSQELLPGCVANHF